MSDQQSIPTAAPKTVTDALTAGRGLVHPEMHGRPAGLMRGFQLGANLPAVDKMCAPRGPVIEPIQDFRAGRIAGRSGHPICTANPNPVQYGCAGRMPGRLVTTEGERRMQFAKIFDIAGTQLLCVLQPSEEDGVPELQVTTYVGKACVTFGNRLVPLGEEVADPDALLARTRQLFDGFDQAQAENAYRVALEMMSEAARQRAEDGDASDAEVQVDPGTVFGVPLVSTALH